MKTLSLVSIVFVSAALTLGTAGCIHKAAPGVTQIPGGFRPSPPQPPPNVEPSNPPPGPKIDEPTTVKTTSEGTDFGAGAGPWGPVIANHNEDAVTLKADTAYFDVDSATIKKSEDKKLEDVAAFLKGHMADALRVEGNCDERGTEKYNLSLGEKRALAVREYLANLGVDARQVVTVTYGKAKPVDLGHTESAWSKNRRADFVLLTPKN